MPFLRIRLPFTVPAIEDLAIPAVSILIIFLAYTSQFLFYHIEPGPLSRKEATWFNIFVLGIWWCYYWACTVDPGRKGWVEKFAVKGEEGNENGEGLKMQKGMRWCKKCEAIKPPRAHHCKKCGRCIPKMDHHCPWTTNCVSHTTFPHFIRFVLYAVISMSLLAYHLYTRTMIIWSSRSLPSYLGPPAWAMAHLLLLLIFNSLTLFALSILLIHAVHALLSGTTQIEIWEIERHDALVSRARKSGGFVYTNGGQRVRIQKQEFPYDIGLWANVAQAMGTDNPFMWFLPFGGAPGLESAGNWETNGFEDDSKTWPPPDPDKMPRHASPLANAEARAFATLDVEREAFRRRQEKDYERWGHKKSPASHEQVESSEGDDEDDDDAEDEEEEYEEGIDGEAGWTNSDGDRLRDYGVDEEAEEIFDDDEDIPLGELLRRRRARPFE